MNRSTPARIARAERLERSSPYARPAEAKVKRSSSMISFPGIRSLVSYITHPFARSPSTQGLPITNQDIDQKSESGSEDGWNGEPSQQMAEADVFDLAEAAGRDGPELEDRADKWRARGEIVGGRRDTARRNLQITANGNGNPPLISPVMPGHLAPSLTHSPSMPSFGTVSQPLLGHSSTPSFGNAVSNLTSSLKRRFSPTKPERPLPARSPLPTFAPAPPVAAHSNGARAIPHSTSASSIALKAFLDAKDGQPLSAEDLRVIESLTDNARQESEAGSARNVSKPEVGGWAAGSFTPRSIKPLPSTYTPARPAGSAFGTPAPAFNVGASPSRTSTPGRIDSPGSVRYIGPGWSARRLYPQKKSGLKPLFNFNLGDEGIAKKRRTGEFEVGMDEDVPPVPALPSSISMPNFASSSRSTPKVAEKIASPAKPSPKADPVSVGKRRAADIMLDLLNADMAKSKEPERPPPFIVNPYHPDAQTLVSGPKAAATPVPASPYRNGTPRKSILKLSSSSQTPLRGAAKRLEEAKNAAPSPSKLTALEMLVGRSGSNGSEDMSSSKGKGKAKAVRHASPEMEVDGEEESSEVEDLVQSRDKHRRRSDEAASGDDSMGSPPKRVRIVEPEPAPEPFKPWTAPQLEKSKLPELPSSSSTSTCTFVPLATSSEGLKPAAPAPKFTPSPLSRSIVPDEPKFSLGYSPPSAVRTSPKKRKSADLSSIFLSAKDTALAVAKETLPFFTFFLDVSAPADSESTKRAKEEALKRPIDPSAFTFTIDGEAWKPAAPASKPMTSAFTFVPAKSPPAVSASAPVSSGPWTCNLCMLSNPATATEKCTVCEEPRPATKAAAPAATPAPAKSAPAASDGPWTCGLCMLQNPASAVDKCTICDADRPVTSAPAPASAPASAASTSGGQGFNWAAAGGKKPEDKAAGGKWTCGTCMLENPESAKEKCTICDMPRG